MTVPGFLLDWAALPGPAKVLDEARARAEAGRLGRRAQLALDLTPEERADVGRLLSASWAASSDPVSIAGLRAGLASQNATIDDLLVAVGGPLRDLRAERAEAKSSRAADREHARRLLQEVARSNVERDVIDRCLMSASSWTVRAEQIAQVIRFLDGHDDGQPIRLGVLAAQLFGDAHALDRSAGLGRAIARFAAGMAAASEAPYADPVRDPTAWRAAWDSVGVMCDGVSATVLVLNLPLAGNSPAAQLCALRGEPVWLSLRHLHGSLTLTDVTPEIFVCENPAVVESAADALGSRSRPLVCTFGQPNLATMTLLSSLAPLTTLHVRADGDAAGWVIARRLLALPHAEPWRMPEGCTAFEEELIDDLLTDLTR